jgi:hypothetical protein
MWTYLTVPFSLSWSGFEVTEIEPRQEDNQTWRRLSVTFPPAIVSHSAQQVVYFDADGLLRRHDYQVEIAGNSPAAPMFRTTRRWQACLWRDGAAFFLVSPTTHQRPIP